MLWELALGSWRCFPRQCVFQCYALTVLYFPFSYKGLLPRNVLRLEQLAHSSRCIQSLYKDAFRTLLCGVHPEQRRFTCSQFLNLT